MKYSPILLMVLISNLAFSQLDIVQPSDIIMQEFPFDGQTTFDLRANEDEMLNGITPSTVSFSYFDNLNDATLFSNTIGNAHAYTNTANPQTIYVRVQDWFTNEFAITEFDLIVEDNYTRFFIRNNKPILISKTLKEYEELLKNYNFELIHQSHLINLSYLKSYIKKDGGYVVMTDDSHLPISQRKKERLQNILKSITNSN